MKRKASTEDPLWFKDAIIYETHVKAFFDKNNDGIGDFRGLLEKLDYLQELGVTCIWLLPFFPSPLRDDGYDIAYYTNVHEAYGTLDDFRAFLKAAHQRNLQVLIELVINHTSDQHPWFQRARQAPPGSPERDFYVWSDTNDKYKDARIIFLDTETSNWSWDPVAQAYYWHRFFSHQPDLNFDNPAVLKEIIKIMRFWLRMGVDALRLDAIPYLIERDGTICENLPETHKVIKEIRRQLDARFENRVFLAEANQWPSDVRPYFGDGDECHMAFHFPVMPRIFMASRMEDRTPIVEIMKQTPPIPDNCQWGLFLRNHDELTLEMVTDEERDYMYSAYAADPRMRINLGIRRRLAPLMENSRARIELLNSLLFSFPGTPIIYYGDELGMGDNIFLGDRNGVRTPMQWNEDRNAGFSRANPAQLYSPPVMDPVYGYQAVNVEAQQVNPSSLLNWMKRMIALRKLHKVFGRGTIEFLEPSNRKVLVYVRQYEDDMVLCVANLSRFAQPVELDLSKFHGMIPVEMMGDTSFPPIGELPYFLTLGPHAFYWFELQPAESPVELAGAALGFGAQQVTVEVEGSWASLFEGAAREQLERDVLPGFLASRRWFAGKARTVKTVRVADWAELHSAPPQAFLTFLEVEYEDGVIETYTLPVGVGAGEGADALQSERPEWVLAAVQGPEGKGILYDALADDTACRELLAAMPRARDWPSRQGELRGFATAAFGEITGENWHDLAVARGSVEQSNSSVRYGDRLILKLIRRFEPGPNPEFEIARYLTEVSLFDRIPRFAGALEYVKPGQEAGTLGVLSALIANQGDGWETTLEELNRYFENCPRTEPPRTEGWSFEDVSAAGIPEPARETVGYYLDLAATLGRRTGELHRALGAPTGDPAFSPEPMSAGDFESLCEAMTQLAGEALDLLEGKLAVLEEEHQRQARPVLAQRGEILARLNRLREQQPDAVKTRIHGDYHLGQVLVAENDFYILDFEGEPARPLAERRRKQSPLKDVAGMLRSFSYAAHSALASLVERHLGEYERLGPWAHFWAYWSSASFLQTYREALADAGVLPARNQDFAALLEAFILEKALYELRYELNNRPGWVHIPLNGLLELLGAEPEAPPAEEETQGRE